MKDCDLKLHFLLNHEHDFKEVSRNIRRHGFFKEFVSGKSKDRRFIYFKMPDGKFDFVKKMLENTLDKFNINYELTDERKEPKD